MGYILPVDMYQRQYYDNYDRLSESKGDPFYVQPVQKTFNSLLKKELEKPEQEPDEKIVKKEDSINSPAYFIHPIEGKISIKQQPVTSAGTAVSKYINVYV